MQGNPYSSTEPGLGPLMRDVKNKICQDCELVALLEDDTGMELLVCNKIMSLDLPVRDVYRKVNTFFSSSSSFIYILVIICMLWHQNRLNLCYPFHYIHDNYINLVDK